MCGICGFVAPESLSDQQLQQALSRMNAAIAYRGPDAEGFWFERSQRLGFGHRRLAILDLSPLGAQPMHSAAGRYTICFNGEVYNFSLLKGELEQAGARFKGGSDTEVMLAAFEHWGIDRAVQQFVGMFAFALWDAKEKILHLARDRFGVKPLYYTWQANSFLFASELSSILACPWIKSELDQASAAELLAHSCIPSPHSLLRNVFTVPPGHVLSLISSQLRVAPSPTPLRAFWNPLEEVERAAHDQYTLSETDALNELDALVADSVRLRMISDVPLGAFLSGGIDSSLVVAHMQRLAPGKVKTFSIGFDQPKFDEAPYAKEVARHLGTEHHEQYLTGPEIVSEIPSIIASLSEPLADSSYIPTYILSRFTRGSVTVALSGDGGDELTSGYPRHVWIPRLWGKIEIFPRGLRSLTAGLLGLFSERFYENALSLFQPFMPSSASFKRPGEKLRKLVAATTASNLKDFYGVLISTWPQHREVLGPNSAYRPPWYSRTPFPNSNIGGLRQLSYLDTVHYLPDQVLVKVDRASMQHALEAREPLLDHRLFQLSWRFPDGFRFREGKTKWMLREILARYVPRELFERPKAGFSVPLAEWLRGPLQPFVEDMLSTERLKKQDFLSAAGVRKVWEEHRSGQRNWEHALWALLCLQAWREKYSL